MFCDIFTQKQARELLKDKTIWFIGSSNMRSIYKDILWLVTHETVAPDYTFKVKNEPTYLNDKLLSNDTLHNGRNYKETREYKSKNLHLFFHFITRLYLDHFIDLIKSITPETAPDIIFLNSCLWDLTRWGPDGPKQFKENIILTMKLLKAELPAKTRVIWKTTLPVSTSADGAIFIGEIKFIVPMLPWHILEANTYASFCANFFNYDTLDLHHYMRFQGHLRVKDGIHWNPDALRYLTNIILTHLCLCWGKKLPGRFQHNEKFLSLTTKKLAQTETIKRRVNKKSGFFKKLLLKLKNSAKKKNVPLAGIKNKIIASSKAIFKRKRNNKKNKYRGNNDLRECIKRNRDTNMNHFNPEQFHQYTNSVNVATNFTFNTVQNAFPYVPQTFNQINYNNFINVISNFNIYNQNIFSFPANHYNSNNYYSQYNFSRRW